MRFLRLRAALVSVAVLVVAGCGNDQPTDAENRAAFAAGKSMLERVGGLSAAAPYGDYFAAVQSDDGAPGEVVYGARRRWRLDPGVSEASGLRLFAGRLRTLGYRPGPRRGDVSEHHQDWTQGKGCVQVLVSGRRVIVSAGPGCAP